MSKKILIIDDSALMRRVISDIIKSGNDYEVADIARDGLEGFDMIVSNPNMYSAIILDINMPKMNGLELLEKLQKNRIQQTVIVVSTVAKQGAKETIRALELGAFDFVTKPENYLETKGETFKQQIHQMLDVATAATSATPISSPSRFTSSIRSSEAKRAMGTSRETARTPLRQTASIQGASSGAARQPLTTNGYASKLQHMADLSSLKKVDGSLYSGIKSGKNKIVALACSTGGPKSLQQVIPLLPANLDAPVVMVQHMPAGFTASLAARLNEISSIKVKEAADGDVLMKGTVYIAPGGRHLRVVKRGSNHIIQLSQEPAIDGLRPCANIMYESLQTCSFDEITSVVLTGMGSDGTKGIKGLATLNKNMRVIAQNEETCVVYGMPKAIAQSGLVDVVAPLERVAEEITKNVGVS